jgi:hypothetical protein
MLTKGLIMSNPVPRKRWVQGVGIAVVGAVLSPVVPATASAAHSHVPKHRATAVKPKPTITEAFGSVIGRAIAVADVAIVTCPPGTKVPGPQCTPVPTGSYEQNAVEMPPAAGSPEGTYCFRAKGIAPGRKAVVLVSVTDVPLSTPPPGTSTYFGLKATPDAAWEPGAANCASGQFEIRTAETFASSAGLTVTPSGYVSFSFLIIGSS